MKNILISKLLNIHKLYSNSFIIKKSDIVEFNSKNRILNLDIFYDDVDPDMLFPMIRDGICEFIISYINASTSYTFSNFDDFADEYFNALNNSDISDSDLIKEYADNLVYLNVYGKDIPTDNYDVSLTITIEKDNEHDDLIYYNYHLKLKIEIPHMTNI